METGIINGQNGNYLPANAMAVPSYQPPMVDDEGGSTIDFWGIIRRRFFLILFFVLVAIGLGTLYLFTATPRFESTARIQIIPEKPVVVDFGGRVFNDASSRDPLSASHPNSMISTEVLSGVLVEGGLIRSETFAELVNPARPDEIGQTIYEYLTVNLQIEQDRNDEFMYELKFRSKFKSDSGRFLNSLVNVYQKRLTQGFQKDIGDSITKLENVSKQFTSELAAAEEAIRKFREANPVPKLDATGMTEARRMVDIVTPQLQEAWSELNEKRTLI